jgi:hypothetical protein
MPHALDDQIGRAGLHVTQLPASSIGAESNVGARSIGGERVMVQATRSRAACRLPRCGLITISTILP